MIVFEWIIKDNCFLYVYCYSKVCYLGYNIILCECNCSIWILDYEINIVFACIKDIY